MEINGFKDAKDYLDEVNRIFEKRQAPEMRAAMKFCNMALSKQIPEAPELEGDGYAPGTDEIVYDTWICPRCGHSYEYQYDNYFYCPFSGQAIKRDKELEDDNSED